MVLAASARKTTGLMSGPATTARQPEKRANASAPIIVVIVCVPTPSGTALASSGFCPKIISLKTQQKTKIISPQISPEVTEAITAWRVMPRRSRSASRHTSTSAASEEKRGRRGCRKERPAWMRYGCVVAGASAGCCAWRASALASPWESEEDWAAGGEEGSTRRRPGVVGRGCEACTVRDRASAGTGARTRSGRCSGGSMTPGTTPAAFMSTGSMCLSCSRARREPPGCRSRAMDFRRGRGGGAAPRFAIICLYYVRRALRVNSVR